MEVVFGLRITSPIEVYDEKITYTLVEAKLDFAPMLSHLRMFLCENRYKEVKIFITMPDGFQKGPTTYMVGMESDIVATVIETTLWKLAKEELKKEKE